jgi:hypothetical protein
MRMISALVDESRSLGKTLPSEESGKAECVMEMILQMRESEDLLEKTIT